MTLFRRSLTSATEAWPRSGTGMLRLLASCLCDALAFCWRSPAGVSRGHPSVGLCRMGLPQSTPTATAPGRCARLAQKSVPSIGGHGAVEC